MIKTRRHRKPTFSAQVFWDIDPSKLDVDKNKSYTITKVFEQGNSDDIGEVFAYYTRQDIREALTKAECLRPRAVRLGQSLLRLQESDFHCRAPENVGDIAVYA